MNSENSKTSDPHRLVLYLEDEIVVWRSDKHIALSNLSIYNTWKNKKPYIKTINLKYKLQHGLINSNYLKITSCNRLLLFWVSYKKHKTLTDNSTIRIYIRKLKNRVTFKTKIRHHLKLLSLETMKSFESP